MEILWPPVAAFHHGFMFIVLGLVLFTPQVTAFWRLQCEGIAGISRIDPIISPGKVSAHAHSIKGASGKLKRLEPDPSG
jgi:hypothetical protein